ncbi:MAG: I78 family peptidase inhibitor [Paracoccaceae bacterium]
MRAILGVMSIAALATCSTAPDDLPPLDEPLGSTGSLETPPDVEVNELEDGVEIVTEDTDPSEDLTLTSCGAHLTLDLIGQPLDGNQSRLPANHRVIDPSDVVTQDYDASRMNVFVTYSGLITKIDCG